MGEKRKSASVSSVLNKELKMPKYITPSRIENKKWLTNYAPNVAELYEGCLSMIYGNRIPGWERFVCHSIREIRNKLPVSVTGQKRFGRVNYEGKINKLCDAWNNSPDFDIDKPLADMPKSDGEQHQVISIPLKLYTEIAELIKTYEGIAVSNREKAANLFKTCLPETQGQQLTPIVKQWLNITEWFESNTHVPDDETVQYNDRELVEKFEEFESMLEILTGVRKEFFSNIDEIDEILKQTNN